jgi:N-acetylmuramoyl-L-alanine amidase
MFGAPEVNELTKVLHHHGARQGTKPDQLSARNLELGKIIFYFAKKPIVNALSSPRSGTESTEQEFFFPLADAKSAESIRMINQHYVSTGSKEEKPLYTVQLSLVKVPIKGIKMKIAYDPERVHYAMESFQAITMQQGVVLRFFNQTLLDEIKNKGKTVLRTVQTKHKGVVIDCGHGGTDRGTCGFFNIREKDVTLDIGLQVAQLLRHKGVEVFLTRSADVDVALDERTSFANACKSADILVSIHANNGDRSARGIETFCLTPRLFKKCGGASFDSAATAAQVLENQYKNGQTLAHVVHENVVSHAQKMQTVVDRFVKNSVSQVLLGANMPSALIELGFLSNESEAALFKDSGYRQLLAQGICKGIISYLDKMMV